MPVQLGAETGGAGGLGPRLCRSPKRGVGGHRGGGCICFSGLIFVAFFAGDLDAFEFVATDESFAEHFAAGVKEEGGVSVLGAGEAVNDGVRGRRLWERVGWGCRVVGVGAGR